MLSIAYYIAVEKKNLISEAKRVFVCVFFEEHFQKRHIQKFTGVR